MQSVAVNLKQSNDTYDMTLLQYHERVSSLR